jgi:putative endonuclease
MYYTYVLLSKKDNRLYTGFTGDLRKRFAAHNAGKIPATKNRGPFELIYYEACLSEQDATAREKYLKQAWGKISKKRLKRFQILTGCKGQAVYRKSKSAHDKIKRPTLVD